MDEKTNHIRETFEKHKPGIIKAANLFTYFIAMAMIEHSQAIANAIVHDAETASIVPSKPYVCKRKTCKKNKSTDENGFIVETTTKQIYEAYNEYKECEI